MRMSKCRVVCQDVPSNSMCIDSELTCIICWHAVALCWNVLWMSTQRWRCWHKVGVNMQDHVSRFKEALNMDSYMLISALLTLGTSRWHTNNPQLILFAVPTCVYASWYTNGKLTELLMCWHNWCLNMNVSVLARIEQCTVYTLYCSSSLHRVYSVE